MPRQPPVLVPALRPAPVLLEMDYNLGGFGNKVYAAVTWLALLRVAGRTQAIWGHPPLWHDYITSSFPVISNRSAWAPTYPGSVRCTVNRSARQLRSPSCLTAIWNLSVPLVLHIHTHGEIMGNVSLGRFEEPVFVSSYRRALRLDCSASLPWERLQWEHLVRRPHTG